jgi:hypothetical protein
MSILSRRDMFSGIAVTHGAACLAQGNNTMAEDAEYMFAPGLIYLKPCWKTSRAGLIQ